MLKASMRIQRTTQKRKRTAIAKSCQARRRGTYTRTVGRILIRRPAAVPNDAEEQTAVPMANEEQTAVPIAAEEQTVVPLAEEPQQPFVRVKK